MKCKLCGAKMRTEGGITNDMATPIHHDRYDCPNRHTLWITHGEDTPTKEQWIDEKGDTVQPRDESA